MQFSVWHSITKPRDWRVATVFLALPVLLLACGGGSDGERTATPASVSPVASPAATGSPSMGTPSNSPTALSTAGPGSVAASPAVSATPSTAPSPTATGSPGGGVPAGFHAPGTQTGIASVDTFLNTVGQEPVEVVVDKFAFLDIACAPTTGGVAPDVPPCDDLPAGTVRSVFPMATSCTLNYAFSREQAAEMLRAVEGAYLHSVWQTTPVAGGPLQAVGSYLVLFGTEQGGGPGSPLFYLDANGTVIRAGSGCGPFEGVVPAGSTAILAPIG